MTSLDRPVINAWEPDPPRERNLYPDELGTIMTEPLDTEHPLPNKINNNNVGGHVRS